jgi:general secretion pathway protein B
VSFILEALRKSEQDRQRQAGPGFAELRPVMTRPGFPVWAVALGALLAINLIVLLVVMIRREESNAAPAPTSTTSPAPAPPGASPAPNPAPSNVPGTTAMAPMPTQVPAQDYEARDSRVNLDSQARDQDYGIPEEPVPEEEPELQPPPRATASGAEEADAQLPTLGEATLKGASLPELHLDIHVYAAQPADRFVFLNNRKYREGGETPEGTKVERITRDGVVLNHRGVRFLLPRQ